MPTDTEQLKFCRYCKSSKPLSEFALNTSRFSKDGRQSRCRDCFADFYRRSRPLKPFQEAPLRLIPETDKSYAAGIIDGEGSISVTRKKNKRGDYCYGVNVEVRMTDEDVLLWFFSVFGGRLSKPEKARKPQWRLSYRWWVSGPDAAAFLKIILPYLKIKKARSEYAILLGEGTRTRRNVKYVRGWVAMNDEERETREKLAMAIRKENSRSNIVKVNSVWGVN